MQVEGNYLLLGEEEERWAPLLPLKRLGSV